MAVGALDAIEDEAQGRTIRRRRPLPGGRAVVGALLVATSLVGLFEAHARATTVTRLQFVVARQPLVIGQVLARQHLELMAMELPETLATERAFRSIKAVVGATVVAPVAPGELVQASALVRHYGPGRGMEISVAIDRSSAAGGALQPGELLDVTATYGTGADAFTIVVARGARVIRVEGSGPGLANRETVVAVLAVSRADEVMALAHASHAGELTFVRTRGGIGAPSSPYRPAPADAG